MEALLPIIIQVVTGVIGGQAVGAALKQVDMSQVIKIISGGVGGLGGGLLLGGMGGDGGALGGILGDVIGGGAGGAVLTGIVGMVMKQMGNR